MAGVDERGVVDAEEQGAVAALFLALALVEDAVAKSDSVVSCFSDLTSVDLSFFFGLFAVVVAVACLVSFPTLSST